MISSIDDAFFGGPPFGKFCEIQEKSWKSLHEKILFPKGKCWQDYVLQNRLEITCGEGPFLASRYDAATGRAIPVGERCGILDRKLRVVSENTSDEKEWLSWTKKATKSCYAYDWQGDNVFLARQNLLMDLDEHFFAKFGFQLPDSEAKILAKIIAWNVWQMDGLKFVVPQSCKNEVKIIPATLFDAEKIEKTECSACKSRFELKKMRAHNGIFCRIMDWSENKAVLAVDLLKTAVEKPATQCLFERGNLWT